MSASANRNPYLVAFVLFMVAIVLSVILADWQFAAAGLTENSTQLFARYTARLSCLFFLPVFAGQALYQLIPNDRTRWLIQYRRQLGLAFALAHGIHLFAIVLHFNAIDAWFTPEDIPALLIYLFIGVMAVTSNSFSVKTLGTGWRVIHKIGLYGIFVGFFYTYLGRIQSHGTYESDIAGDLWLYMVLFLLVTCAWLLRLVAFWLKRREQTLTASA